MSSRTSSGQARVHATTDDTLAAAALLTFLALQGCSSGSGGSDVGAHAVAAPTPQPRVLNGGTTDTFREGAEVLLTGKASRDSDGPVIGWAWRQTGGPSVRLIELNTTTVSFTAPHVSVPTELTFELTVEDSTLNKSSASIDVNVLPGRDSDKFLSLDVGRSATFDTFKIVAALAGGAKTGGTARPFSLSASAYVVYPPRGSPDADCAFYPAEFAGRMPESIASGCRVVWLEDLTPQPLASGGTGLAGEWPAGIEAPDEDERSRVSRWWNPRFDLKVPRLDVREFNQQFVATRHRDQLLDASVAHKARILLALALTAPENQQDATMILPELIDGPIALPNQASASAPGRAKSIENAGVGLPTSAIIPLETVVAFLEGREGALTAEVYYRTVDPNNSRTSLDAWLRQAGFTSADGTLLPEAIAGTGQFAHAVYINNFDLGFGRQMFTRTDELGNVFSFVKNYSTLEGAIRQLDSFVTVVTEYSPLLKHTDPTPKFVKFFTYVEDGSGGAPRVGSFDFDGRGERFTPGNCVSCHGGARPPAVSEFIFDAACGDPTDAACYAWPTRNRDGAAVANGDLGGTFLPWDVGSLLFSDTDPAITHAPPQADGTALSAELLRDYGDFSRSRQQAQLKKLNQAAYATYDIPAHDAARRLVEHWYGGVDQNGNLVASTFDDSAAAPGWRDGELVPDPVIVGGMLMNPPNAAQLYHDVYAKHCRSCHTAIADPVLRFDTYQKFIAQEVGIRQTVFRTGVMPAARLTMDRFWSPFDGGPAPGAGLANHIAELRGESPAPAPGTPSADVAGLDPPPIRGDTVYLDGSNSAFARSYAWSVTPPPGSRAALTDADSRYPVFVVDVPGRYVVTLAINQGSTDESTMTKSVDVTNRPPVASNDLYALDLPASTTLRGSVLTGTKPDSDPDDDALTVALAAGGRAQHGNVTVNADGSFIYAYTGTIPASPDRDSFSYEIADGFGGTARGVATILLSDAAREDRPTPPRSLTVVDGSTVAGQGSVFATRLTWLAARDDDPVVGYNVYKDGTLLEFVPSAAPPDTVVSYMDRSAQPDENHTYRVTARDAQNESDLSNEAAATVVPSLRRNIQSGWGTGADSLWRVSGCIGCHRGAPGGLTLSGTADQTFTELIEDANDNAPHRMNGNAPMRSLILCKPLIKSDPNSCPHEGGAFLVRSDPRYGMLLRWIDSAAPNN
jgi:hypothetical protein